MSETYDVAIIGGGVVGSAIAYELSQYRLRVALLERDADVARGTSGKNSGVVHTGINVPPGSLKAKLNVQGAAIFEDLCQELDVPFKRVGKLVVASYPEEEADLENLIERGRQNGVPELEIVDQHAIRRMEPNIRGYAALHAPTAAITCPYSLTIALAEAAATNGVAVHLNAPVWEISPGSRHFTIKAGVEVLNATLIINAAGLYADRIARMAGTRKYRIHPCRGEYIILDKNKGGLINRMVYPVPPKDGAGLGIHITPTVDGNILLGPSATYVKRKDDARTTGQIRRQLLKEAAEFLPGIGPRDVITAYSGLRPKTVPASVGGFGDFIIEELDEHPGMMNLVGIESPGLTAAPAIALHVTDWVLRQFPASPIRHRRDVPSHARRFREHSLEEQSLLAAQDPDYGTMICRCETVTKREVLDAIRNPLGAASLTSIKYRSRATMGRCQGSTCGPRVVDLLLQEGYRPEDLTLAGDGSWMFLGELSELRRRAKNEGKVRVGR